MHIDGASELQSFQQFLVEVVSRGAIASSPEEALDEWRTMHPLEDDLSAVQEALDDMQAGDAGVTLEEFDNQFRQKHNLPKSL
jgi:hypothetical protein